MTFEQWWENHGRATGYWLREKDKTVALAAWNAAFGASQPSAGAAKFDERHDKNGGASCEGSAERLLSESPSPIPAPPSGQPPECNCYGDEHTGCPVHDKRAPSVQPATRPEGCICSEAYGVGPEQCGKHAQPATADPVEALIATMRTAAKNCMRSEDAGNCIEAEKAEEWAAELESHVLRLAALAASRQQPAERSIEVCYGDPREKPCDSK